MTDSKIFIPRRSRWQIATMVAIVVSIGWNFATYLFPSTRVPISQLSSTVFANVKIIPANYTFAIWGLIYVGLVDFGFYQLDARRSKFLLLQQARFWVILVSLLQCAWITLLLYQQMLLSSLAMLGVLYGLSRCYLSFHSPQEYSRQLSSNWVPRIFSLYLGWICISMMVNVAATLNWWGWDGSPLTPELWTILLIAGSFGLAILLLRIYDDRVFGGAVIWAVSGIVIANITTLSIVLVGWFAIVILTILMLKRAVSI